MLMETGRIGPQGRITISRVMRERLGLRANDQVVMILEGGGIRLIPLRTQLEESFAAVPALSRSLAWSEMTEIAHEEHARMAAVEGLDATGR